MRVTHHFSHMIIPRKLNFSKVEKWDSVRRRIHTVPNHHFWSKKLFLGKTFNQKMNDKKIQIFAKNWSRMFFFSTSIFGGKYRFLDKAKIRLLEQCEFIDDDIITTREEERGMMCLNFFPFLSFEDDLANYLVKVIIIQQQKR